jgi:hypothetical protein
MKWIIEPSTAKNVVEFIRYENDKGFYIVYAKRYRWGQVFVKSPNKPYYDYSEDGTSFVSCDNNLGHCYSSEIVEFSKKMHETAKRLLIDFIDQYSIGELEDMAGWHLTKSEIRIYGPLQINKV